MKGFFAILCASTLLSATAFAEQKLECNALSMVINDNYAYYLDGDSINFEIVFQKKQDILQGKQTVEFKGTPYALIILADAQQLTEKELFTTLSVFLIKKQNGKNTSLGGSIGQVNSDTETNIINSEIIQLALDSNFSLDDGISHMKLVDNGILKNGDFLGAVIRNCEMR